MRGAVVVLVACAATVTAQSAPVPRPGVTIVSGIVYDSLAKRPLAGAVVQIALASNLSALLSTATADSLGRYRLDSIPVGHYVIGFIHPMLDSLGIDPPLRSLDVTDAKPVRGDLGIPSPERFAASICRRSPHASPPGAEPPVASAKEIRTADSTALVFGFVRNAHTLTPVAHASVTAQWLELGFGAHGFEQHVPRFTVETRDNGWFAFCGVPSPTSLGLVAAAGTDSTGAIEVAVHGPGVVRRDLFVGASDVAAAKDSTDTLSAVPRFIHVGGAALRGVVIKSAGGGPIVGARVSLDGGPTAVANDRGEWAIPGAPGGTRMLTVRAVGYYPEHRAVDVLDAPATPAPRLVVSLSTLKAVLDTVKVTAQRVYDRDQNGFGQRRRSGVGYYVASQDLEAMHLRETSDLFWRVPSVQVVPDTMGSKLVMRGVRGTCEPAIFIDGLNISGLTTDDIDAWVQPDNVTGIEVYRAGTAPMQYQLLNGCGSILIWTR